MPIAYPEAPVPTTDHRVPVTFVVPVRNDARSLRRCLQSIVRGAGRTPFELLVLDNGSTDDSATVAHAMGATVLTLPGLKVGELRNRGAAAARGGVMAFVDADHELAPGWLDAAVDTLHQPGIGAVGFPYQPPDPPTWVQRVYDGLRRRVPGVHDTAWLGAGNMAVRSRAFVNVGGFDTTLEACEDVDFCQRLTQAGYVIKSDSRLRSVHYGDPSSIRALFKSELWRGRDNLRVSARDTAWRNLPSIVIPIADLVFLLTIVIGLAGPDSRVAALTAGALFLFTSLLRATAMFLRLRDRLPLDPLRALIVAITYDTARALALITRIPHRRAVRPAALAR
jgi:glycosyltransferase involved in cell wall biosynthesis